MKFSQLAKLYETLEKTGSHNAMRKALSDFFKKTPKKELESVAYLTLGRIAPSRSEIVIGMAAKMVVKSIAVASKQKEAAVLRKYKSLGDVGKTAEQYATRGGTLTVKQAFDGLNEIASTTGAGSQEKKIRLLAQLLKKSTPLGARYLARMVLGDLRMGLGDKTVLDALSLAFTGSKEARKQLEHAYTTCPDVGLIAHKLATKGITGIKKIGLSVGVPVQSMLCQRIKNLVEIDKKMKWPVVVEEKYDGERIQVHKKGKTITLFSRRLDNVTDQFPDVVHAIRKAVKAKSCVLDSEVVPVDKKGNLLPFQVLMQRKRKHDVEAYIKKIPVKLFVFDIIYHNGKSLMAHAYKKRYAVLKRTLRQTPTIRLAVQSICKNVACIEELFNKVVQHGGEGVVVKNMGGAYEAGVRGWSWIKWKPEYIKGERDTYDLVVVGAYRGRGKRAGTYGALLCAVYDKRKDEFQTFCKLGSGFTDKELAGLKKRFKKTAKKPARVTVKQAMKPDVWFVPEQVVEVVGAEITKSPSHTSTYALRFPRFLRWRDKKPEQAATLREIKQ